MEANERLERLESARRNIVLGIPGNPIIEELEELEELQEWINAGGGWGDLRICLGNLLM